MSTGWFIALNGVLSFGVPLVWGIYELRTVNRPRPGGWSPPPAPPPAPPVGPKPLPDCLIPKRIRVLEDA